MANAMTGEGTGNKNLTYSIKLEAEEYGIAFRKGSDMTAKTNELMAGMMKDGTLDKLASSTRSYSSRMQTTNNNT